MPKRIRMPKLSDTMEEGVVLAWRKRVGDTITRGEVLADIETDKADMEFESFTEGVIHSFAVEAGSTVPVGQLICVIRLPGESDADMEAVSAEQPVPAPSAFAAPAARPVAAPVPGAPSPVPVVMPGTAPGLPPAVPGARIVAPFDAADDRLRATPAARRLAEERSIDLSELQGSGPLGAILVGDLESYLADLESQAPDADGVRATPVAMRIATDLGVDLEAVKGSGPGGRITKSDLERHLEGEKNMSKEREAELFRGAIQPSQKRKALIRNMVRSKAEAPHFYIQMDVQTDALKALRDRLNVHAGERPKLTYTHFIIKAAALALEAMPEVNAMYRTDEGDIAIYEAINIGLAVDVNDELVAPTVKDCQGKDVYRLAADANGLIQRARMRKLAPADYADGTFTISNLGMFGVDRFYAIITPPQSCILSVSALAPRPIAVDGQIEIATMTTLGLSVDHRVVDGVKAAQFLSEVKRVLEDPQALMKNGESFGA